MRAPFFETQCTFQKLPVYSYIAHVSAAYIVQCHTSNQTLCMRFFSYKLNLPVNSLFLCMDVFFPNAILLGISFHNIHTLKHVLNTCFQVAQ